MTEKVGMVQKSLAWIDTSSDKLGARLGLLFYLVTSRYQNHRVTNQSDGFKKLISIELSKV